MNKIQDLFLKCRYQQCLKELETMTHDGSMENSFILDNNRLICNILHNQCEDSFEQFLELYDNLRILLKHSQQGFTSHVHVSILINASWNALSLLGDGCPKHEIICNSVLHRILEYCVDASHHRSTNDYRHPSFVVDFFTKLLFLYESNLKQGHLILELAACSVLIIMSRQDCYEEIFQFLPLILKNKTEIMAFLQLEQQSNYPSFPPFLFKFFYFKSADDILNDTECLFSSFQLIYFFKLPRLISLTNCEHNCSSKEICLSFKNYCTALKNYQLGNHNIALGYLLEGLPSCSFTPLLNQYRCLLGQVYSKMGERCKAVEHFTEATKLIKSHPIGHYYLGHEYGLMGLHKKMLKSYQNLIMSYKKREERRWSNYPWIERTLDSLHVTKINKTAAIYLLAIAFGINEMFEDASVAFDKLLSQRNLCSIFNNEKSNPITLPHIITIYHESTAINLLTGNLSKAEDLCRRAMSIYIDRENQETEEQHNTDLHGTKDIVWIRRLLEVELQININSCSTKRYFEGYLSFFDEDVIGILLLAELQRIQSSDEYRITLNQALLLLSKYIARAQKETVQSDRVVLVKALTSKTCLQIAKIQATTKPYEDVDKMFKRALSCNNGDKDVLYHYASFLVSAGKMGDAEKLWKTFYEKKTIIEPEESQSLALRYLLRTQISQRQIENLSIHFL